MHANADCLFLLEGAKRRKSKLNSRQSLLLMIEYFKTTETSGKVIRIQTCSGCDPNLGRKIEAEISDTETPDWVRVHVVMIESRSHDKPRLRMAHKTNISKQKLKSVLKDEETLMLRPRDI